MHLHRQQQDIHLNYRSESGKLHALINLSAQSPLLKLTALNKRPGLLSRTALISVLHHRQTKTSKPI